MTTASPLPDWLREAVIYQVYPQSYADSDGDGIGDLNGIRSRLDYLAWLGINVLWISPCFASEFRDGGYDVTDYLAIDPRYGTEADLVALFDEARSRGIRVLLDLVPGHTSDRHPWFLASAGDPACDRYIWTDGEPGAAGEWVASPGARPGRYLANFYAFQPALNYGYARPHPDEPWRQGPDAPGPRANRAALRETMAYWFERGAAGFRVDMAFSLVKDDPDRTATAALWGEMREWIDRAYPDRVLISEWGDPATSVPAGIHADFFLHFVGPALRSLWGNAQGSHAPAWGQEPCFFAPEGQGSMTLFVEYWRQAHRATAGRGFAVVPTANHDFSRLACGTRTAAMLPPAFTFLLTWPTLPAIYYGDEIGMRYVPGTPDVEGAQLGPEARQGSRTPMQWDGSANAGFSTAPADSLYLPIDPDPARPTVEDSRTEHGSLLHTVRDLIALRTTHPGLGTRGDTRILSETYPFAYLRAGRYLVVVNPAREPATLAVPGLGPVTRLHGSGVTVRGQRVEAQGFSHAVYELATPHTVLP